MVLKVVVHPEPDGGYWAEVPSLPGCITEADSYEELLEMVRDAVEGWLSVERVAPNEDGVSQVIEIAV